METTKPVLPTLAGLITERRKALGLTNDEQLAALTGRHRTTVSGWSRGRGWPDPSLFEVVASWLGISYDELTAIVVAEHVANGRRFRPPRVPSVDVLEIDAALNERLEDFERRLSALEQPGAAQSHRPGPAAARKGSKK